MIYDSNNVFKKQIKLSCQDGTGGLAVAIVFDIWSSDQLFIYIFLVIWPRWHWASF